MTDSSTPSKGLSSPLSQFRRYPLEAKALVGKLQTSDDGSALEREGFLSLYLPQREVPECFLFFF